MTLFLEGLLTALEPQNLAALLGGSVLGVFAGAVPGLSSTVGLALVLRSLSLSSRYRRSS